MTMLLDERLRDLATQTHLLETKVSSLCWMAAADVKTLKSMTRAQAHLMLAECDLLDAIEANEKEATEELSTGIQPMPITSVCWRKPTLICSKGRSATSASRHSPTQRSTHWLSSTLGNAAMRWARRSCSADSGRI